ncbi:hypothetical protein I3843_01G046300 [Carya illinoinensis]|nr:hypothetical protein I3843_01G046300 [Carya illinoinensis]
MCSTTCNMCVSMISTSLLIIFLGKKKNNFPVSCHCKITHYQGCFIFTLKLGID